MGIWDYRKLPVGSRFTGTLVCKRTVPDNYHPGQDQMVYDFKSETGDVVSVFGKPLIDMRMKTVRLGQIVAMEYKGESTKKKPGMQPAKIVEIYSDPKLVDEEWLKEQEEINGAEEIAAEFGGEVVQPQTQSFNPPGPEPDFMAGVGANNPMAGVKVTAGAGTLSGPSVTASTATAADPKLATIIKLAKEKIPGTTDANYKKQVMDATGIAFLTQNLDKIIEVLSA